MSVGRPRIDGMAAAGDFVHLHAHTEYSMLDGAARIEELLTEAERLGQKALAITDHGYLFGAFDFWQRARNHGIKPIIGVEAYVTPGTSRFDQTRVRWGEEHQRKDDISGGGSYTHMTLLSYNNVGMRNLFRASSIASLDSVFGKWPRLDPGRHRQYRTGQGDQRHRPAGAKHALDQLAKMAGHPQAVARPGKAAAAGLSFRGAWWFLAEERIRH